PDLDLVVRETVTATLVAELAEGSLDVVIASVPLGHGGLSERPLFEDAFLLATPTRGAYALTGIADASEIPSEALLLLEDGHCLRDQALSACGGIDSRRLRSSGVTSLATILQLVAAGQGITLLPEMFLDSIALPPGTIRLTRFGVAEPRRTVGLAWRRSNPMAEEFERLAEVVAACGQEVRANAMAFPSREPAQHPS
ncbi:MAG TPA: LysR substrate-binding domain-containing protein, partial [Methylomirabilota bacterium]|nr:LysR substrate-binding domain-containing protein [Methylomirabilota bacterium]